MVASVAGLPVMAVYCKVQLLSQSAYSTMAMTEVVEIISGLRMPVIEGVSLVGEGISGRATMYGKGGRAVRLSVAVRFYRLVSFFSLKGLDRQGIAMPNMRARVLSILNIDNYVGRSLLYRIRQEY